MSKTLVSLAVPDLSGFAKALRAQLKTLDQPPGHVELLNLLARAAGHANFQALRASAVPGDTPAADPGRLEKLIRHFDASGVMIRWPGKTSHQDLCLWIIWSRIPPEQSLSESEINALIRSGHSFGDHALLRRSLVDMKMLARTPDGRLYRRIEKTAPADAMALLEAILPRISARPD